MSDGRWVLNVGPRTLERTIEWRRGMRWRHRVEAALAGAGLTFTQWLVLDGLRELIAERLTTP